MTIYDVNILVQINSLLVLDIMEWHVILYSWFLILYKLLTKHLYIFILIVLVQYIFNTVTDWYSILFNPQSLSVLTHIVVDHWCPQLLFFCAMLFVHNISYSKQNVQQTFISKRTQSQHTRHGRLSSNCDVRPFLLLSK